MMCAVPCGCVDAARAFLFPFLYHLSRVKHIRASPRVHCTRDKQAKTIWTSFLSEDELHDRAMEKVKMLKLQVASGFVLTGGNSIQSEFS
ncbi:hypothetical protein EUGRSUZ_K02577 [Eucalyptus grandis]|uniref:Uncharacterized protein n=2 Tax=Eucalyptus grandis TaxID=71139 RepID=A0ACC3IXV9_EUCGR|nr:hypothetical protein EUGRSUZ_K02577 [Eucalyptus grandis]